MGIDVCAFTFTLPCMKIESVVMDPLCDMDVESCNILVQMRASGSKNENNRLISRFCRI
jgi:hypothetical protein